MGCTFFTPAVTMCCILLPLGFSAVTLRKLYLLYALLTFLQGIIKEKCH